MNRAPAYKAGRLIMAALITVIFSAAPAVVAQTDDGRMLRWEQYDVTIDEIYTAVNRFRVTESYELIVETGPFSYGFAEIPMDRLTTIEDVMVYEEDVPLERSCTSSSGTFCVTQGGENLSINYYFRTPIQSGQRRSITIEYMVYGALRSYDEGDELDWFAIPEDRSFPIMSSTVRVVMPEDRPPLETLSDPDNWPVTVEANVVTWRSPRPLDNDDSFEVGVRYAHDPQMQAASWQAGYDRWQWYEHNLKPFVSLGLLVLTLAVGIGGVLMIVVRYQKTGRDPLVAAVPTYLTEPPSDELPGVVGALLDEKADMKDIIATLVDLARRGYIVIEQTNDGSFLSSAEFHFHRTQQNVDDLTIYERTLLDGIFPYGVQETTLSSLRNKFYRTLPGIKSGIYSELVRRGYFPRSPDSTRNLWIFGGIGLLVLTGGWIWLSFQLLELSMFMVCPAFGLGAVGLAALIMSNMMPAKTLKGAQEAAKWKAFRYYLSNIGQYTDLSQAAEQFEKYVAYAVAFGIERQWFGQFAPVLKSMPTWYYPTYMGGPWHGGYRGSSAFPGGRGLSGPGGLNSMSASLTQGLNAMSTGMTQLLNDASRVMTSTPKSSGSGGGSFGGGGSGGGSRGFG